MYIVHPSPELNDLFFRKPFQGAEPESAEYLFVGLDANYEADVHQKPIFQKLREYHDDGVRFWQEYGVHHPFLLPEYTGDGKFYHRSFARIGLKPEHAPLVSFIELLHVPTVGRNKLHSEDLSTSHLEFIKSVILDGRAKHIFVPSGVARLMRSTDCFSWLPKTVEINPGKLSTLYRRNAKTIYSHLHFSVYGKFEKQKIEELAAIHEILVAEV